MCHGIFPLNAPKPSSKPPSSALIVPTHPATSFGLSAWIDWIRLGLRGGSKGVPAPFLGFLESSFVGLLLVIS
jgi:hypothetical protein